MTNVQTVRLRNGAEEVKSLVSMILFTLKDMWSKGEVTTVYELAMLCRDPEHKLFGDTGDVLKKLSLVQPDGRVHDSIRNIVLSAVEGEGLDMRLQSPIAEPETVNAP